MGKPPTGALANLPLANDLSGVTHGVLSMYPVCTHCRPNKPLERDRLRRPFSADPLGERRGVGIAAAPQA